jgi:hypothetical protein
MGLDQWRLTLQCHPAMAHPIHALPHIIKGTMTRRKKGSMHACSASHIGIARRGQKGDGDAMLSRIWAICPQLHDQDWTPTPIIMLVHHKAEQQRLSKVPTHLRAYYETVTPQPFITPVNHSAHKWVACATTGSLFLTFTCAHTPIPLYTTQAQGDRCP